MKIKVVMLAVVGGGILAGCAIKQTATPVLNLQTREICVVENSAVRSTFKDSYIRALQAKGFLVRVLGANGDTSSCAMTSTYVARWSWDFTIYMSQADLRVYRSGVQVGAANYNSRGGGSRLDKWVDADAKVQEMVSQLFP